MVPVAVPARKYPTSEHAIKAAGEFGRYQIFLFLVLQYSAIIGAGTFALGTFGRLFPEYQCEYIDMPKDQYEETFRKDFDCATIHDEECGNRTVIKRYFKSIVEEWDLICDRQPAQELIFAALLIGRLLGNILGGHIGDYVGRKTVLYPSQFAHCICGALSTACTAWQALAAFFFLIGLSFGIGETTSFVLTAEETTAKYRWIQVSCFQWCLQYPIVAAIAYFTGNWRLYMIIVNVIMGPVLVFYLMFLESPRLLIYHEDYERAAKTLSDIASNRWNHMKVEFEPKELGTISEPRNSLSMEHKFPSPLALFRPWSRAKLTLFLFVANFLRSLTVGLFLQHENGVVNPILDITLFGIVRLWVPIFIVLMDRKFQSFGRRAVFLMFFSALLIVITALEILSSLGKMQTIWGVAFSLIGASLAASGAWMALMIIAVEAYPTAIRGIAFGWVESFNGVGNLVAPYFLRLGNVWPELPGVIMIALAFPILIAGWFVIPETKFKPMNDRIKENE